METISYETEDGGRLVHRYTIGDWQVEIASAYEAVADNWPLHVYAARGRAPLRSDAIGYKQRSCGLQSAFLLGRTIAQSHIEANQ